MDKETRNVLDEQKMISDVIGQPGWKLIEKRFLSKIADLKDAFQVDDSTPEKMLIDLQSRKACAILMEEFMREIIASKDVVIENKIEEDKTYIFNAEK